MVVVGCDFGQGTDALSEADVGWVIPGEAAQQLLLTPIAPRCLRGGLGTGGVSGLQLSQGLRGSPCSAGTALGKDAVGSG